jgi:glutamyl-tRNA synthetase
MIHVVDVVAKVSALDGSTMDAMPSPVTRLAPSPTGTLHLGNARTFLVNWAVARQNGWRIALRIEDLDATRIRPNSDQQLIQTLRWLGIDWDEGPVWQSHDLSPYRSAMAELCNQNKAYACELTRKQIQSAASAPHGHEGEIRFPPQLRSVAHGDYCFQRESASYRFVVDPGIIEVRDEFAGMRVYCPFEECGDFIIWTKLGVPAYQLAVVVDDARQGVTDVMRGDDLLPSAARQTLLYQALNLPMPRWWHLPLVLNEKGHRLAKRDSHMHLETYRERGVTAERIIGLLAKWCGINRENHEMSAHDFLQRFVLDTLPHAPVRFTAADHQWLVS